MLQTPTPTDRGIAVRRGDFATLAEALDYAARAHTGMNFYSARGAFTERLAYADLAVQARAIGARMLGQGLAPGERIGLVAETEADFVRGFLGAVLAGLIPCPLPLPSAFGARDGYGQQIARIAAVAKVSAILLPADYRDLVARGVDPGGLRHFGPLSELGAAQLPLPGPADPDAPAYLQFSSGTTRAPRGIAVSHRALMANIHGMAQALALGPADRGVSWLPFYHDMGLVGCMLFSIGTQMSMDYLATRDFVRRPGLWLSMISAAGATISYAPSFGYQLAAQRARFDTPPDLGSWRVAGIGGDMIKTRNLQSFAEACAPFGFRAESFVPSYGMAELALGLSFAPLGRGCVTDVLESGALERGEARAAAPDAPATRSFARCGLPLAAHEVEIRGTDGQALADRQVGEIFARGPSVMTGYFGNPDATAEVMRPGGWLATGDLGYRVAGEVVVTGRLKDLVIIKGRNIWPQDIEWMLEGAIPGLREGGVAVLGRLGDGLEGEEDLVVVLETRTDDPEQRAALRGEVAAQVAQSSGIVPVVALCRPGALPRTTSGKLSRARTRELLSAGAFDA